VGMEIILLYARVGVVGRVLNMLLKHADIADPGPSTKTQIEEESTGTISCYAVLALDLLEQEL